MAVFSFIYPKFHFSDDVLRHSFLARRGKIPLQTRVSISAFNETRNVLQLEADWNESVTVHIPYFSRHYGLFYYSTENLKNRSQPYILLKELARGQLSRIFKKMFEWQLIGLKVPVSVRRRMKNDLLQMSQLATTNGLNSDFDNEALLIFETLIESSILVLDLFIEQSLLARKSMVELFPVFPGIRFRHSFSKKTLQELEKSDFQLLNPNYSWKDIEPQKGTFVWKYLDEAVEQAEKNQWQFVIGPLIRWEKEELPHWTLEYLNDPNLFERYLFRYLDAVLNRYFFCRYWIVSCGTAAHLGNLLISRRLEWIDCFVQKIRTKNAHAEIFLGIKQPWGDFFWKNSEIYPLELGERFSKLKDIDGYFLEMDFDLSEEASLPRDPFELNWLLDQWSYLGKKIHISFSIPSNSSFKKFEEKTEKCFWNQKIQQEILRRYFLSFLTRKSIAAIYWSYLEDLTFLFDEETDRLTDNTPFIPFSHSGLFQTNGSAKSSYYKLMALIRSYLE